MIKKQIVGVILFTLIIFAAYFSGNRNYSLAFFYALLPLLVMTFGISIYKTIKLHKKYWTYPILISMISPFFVFYSEVKILPINGVAVFLSITSAMLILSFQYNKIRDSIRVAQFLEKIDTKTLVKFYINGILLVIAEELLFRLFIIETLGNNIEAVIISSCLFIYYHFFNRFSASLYNSLDYVFQFLLSLLLGFIFINFEAAIVPVIVGHLIYNSVHLISATIRWNKIHM